MAQSRKTDLDQACVTYAKLKTVQCVGAAKGSEATEGVAVVLDPASEEVGACTFCRTEIQTLEFTESVFRGGGLNSEDHVYEADKLRSGGLREATLFIKEYGTIVHFEQQGPGNSWCALWENPRGREAFPVYVELSVAVEGNVKCDAKSPEKPVYACSPWKTKLADPAKKDKGCCTIS